MTQTLKVNEVRKMYREHFDRPAPRGEDAQTMLDAIETDRAEKAARQAEAAKREAELLEREARDKAERQARIESRGSLEDFIESGYSLKDKSEQNYSFLLARAQRKVKEFETEKTKFMKSLEQDPVHAMSWSRGLFNAAANYSVAKQILDAFEYGPTFEDVKEYAMKEALRKARSATNQSTSQTSNLTDQAIMEAWAEVASGHWW